MEEQRRAKLALEREKKEELEEKRQILAKELRNKEKVDAALKAQLEVNNKKDQQFLEINESYKRAMNSLDKSKK